MSADSDMVERVAAAMAAVDRGEGYKVLARAALDASGIGELKAQNAALCEARDALIAELSRERQVRMELQARLLDGDRQ